LSGRLPFQAVGTNVLNIGWSVIDNPVPSPLEMFEKFTEVGIVYSGCRTRLPLPGTRIEMSFAIVSVTTGTGRGDMSGRIYKTLGDKLKRALRARDETPADDFFAGFFPQEISRTGNVVRAYSEGEVESIEIETFRVENEFETILPAKLNSLDRNTKEEEHAVRKMREREAALQQRSAMEEAAKAGTAKASADEVEKDDVSVGTNHDEDALADSGPTDASEEDRIEIACKDMIRRDMEANQASTVEPLGHIEKYKDGWDLESVNFSDLLRSTVSRVAFLDTTGVLEEHVNYLLAHDSIKKPRGSPGWSFDETFYEHLNEVIKKLEPSDVSKTLVEIGDLLASGRVRGVAASTFPVLK